MPLRAHQFEPGTPLHFRKEGSNMLMMQCELARGTRRMVTWLDYDKRIKEGTLLTLQKKEGIWQVKKKGEPVDTAERPINRWWAVGGL